jgi:hypothetical protein
LKKLRNDRKEKEEKKSEKKKAKKKSKKKSCSKKKEKYIYYGIVAALVTFIAYKLIHRK